ncbi:MAG: DUF697 domain-containing protein [Bacteroidetes bacterium]|nr:DUF697 domain-containing protein [Bacteroidota bacterium]
MAFSGLIDRYVYKKDYTIMDNKERKYRADAMIKNHMVWSMSAGFIPVPVADVLAVTAIQLDMVRSLARIYDVEFKESQGKAIITSLAGSGMARLSANAVKIFPGLGTVVGGITMAALSGASTYAVGEVFKKHFQTGGTFLDFDPERLRKLYREKFEKGKQMAKKMKADKKTDSDVRDKTTSPMSESDVVNRLSQLQELKAKGVITDQEFTQFKERLMNQFNESA